MPETQAHTSDERGVKVQDKLTSLWQKLAEDPRLKGAIPPLEKAEIQHFERLGAVFAEVVGWLRHLDRHLARTVQGLVQRGGQSDPAMLQSLARSYRTNDLAKIIRLAFECDSDESPPEGLAPVYELYVHCLNSLYRPSLAIAKGLADSVDPDLSRGLETVKSELDPDTWEHTFNLAQRMGNRRNWSESPNERLMRALREVIRTELSSKICRSLQQMAIERVNEEYKSARGPGPGELKSD